MPLRQGRRCLSGLGPGCTRTPVASVAMQKAVQIASWRATATTVAPKVAPASSSHRHIVPRSTGSPSRAKRFSIRLSGRPSANLSAMMCASRDGAAIDRRTGNSAHTGADQFFDRRLASGASSIA